MNIYEVDIIEQAIDKISEQNEGEIPDELMQELVEAQTKSITQIDKLCRYVRHLETFSDTCKAETDRINNLRQRAENRMESIKKYLTPFVKERGRFDVGTFRLSIRKSTRVELDDDFIKNNPAFCTIKEVVTPNKEMIKANLESGNEVQGARFVERDNLQIK